MSVVLKSKVTFLVLSPPPSVDLRSTNPDPGATGRGAETPCVSPHKEEGKKVGDKQTEMDFKTNPIFLDFRAES